MGVECSQEGPSLNSDASTRTDAPLCRLVGDNQKRVLPNWIAAGSHKSCPQKHETRKKAIYCLIGGSRGVEGFEQVASWTASSLYTTSRMNVVVMAGCGHCTHHHTTHCSPGGEHRGS